MVTKQGKQNLGFIFQIIIFYQNQDSEQNQKKSLISLQVRVNS